MSSARQKAHFYLYENPTVSDAGTAVTAYNRNRNSATVATTAITHTPTFSATGTVPVLEMHLGSGKSVGGSERGQEEIILKQNEQYLIKIASISPRAIIRYG